MADPSPNTFTIRLQFPDGRAELVPVSASTTVEELHQRHVAHTVPENFRGQFFHMGRPLAPPASTMASHGIIGDTVVQIFIRRPVPVGGEEGEAGAGEINGGPVNPNVMSALFGFGIASAWVFFFLDLEEDEDAQHGREYGEMDLVVLICLIFLTALFVVSGGLRQLLRLCLR
ncbi:hypothetical protein BV898_05468 [Hypsibius exemplaris]|uniref:Ubiquitin-like domain-containing protein n=1 Tax=Hypsibius exemplaris TaxID=2072580 RepID=A0A1W0WZZ4_HYPEX|nr:hypothetical protein BV898_05468 [Hypsibius exemplaris]